MRAPSYGADKTFTTLSSGTAAPVLCCGHVVSVNNNNEIAAWGSTVEPGVWRVTIFGPGPINGRTNTVSIPQATYSGLEAGDADTVTVQQLDLNGNASGSFRQDPLRDNELIPDPRRPDRAAGFVVMALPIATYPVGKVHIQRRKVPAMPGNTVTSARRFARRGLRLLFSLILVGATVGASFALQQPAQAAGTSATATVQPMSSTADCPAGDLCWWVDTNQRGKMHPVRDAIYDWRTQKEPTCNRNNSADPAASWDDCASTLYNNKSGYGAQVYSEPYPKGGSPSSSTPGYCLQPGSRVALDLTTVHYSNENSLSLNDTISSNRWRTGGC